MTKTRKKKKKKMEGEWAFIESSRSCCFVLHRTTIIDGGAWWMIIYTQIMTHYAGEYWHLFMF